MLVIQNITVRLGGNPILSSASATLAPKSRVGVVGRNGCGKSTLLKVLSGTLETDNGTFGHPKGMRIGYVAQDAPGGSISPLQLVLKADVERIKLLEELESCNDPQRLAEIHDRLQMIDAHGAPARAARILAGLGFNNDEQSEPLDNFSGGWRMRVSLAAVLFSEPDLLLLDEPSNHLDLEAQLWLESFLKNVNSTLVIVSHERDLLNSVANYILHVEAGKTILYAGNYDSFEQQRRERQNQVEAMRVKQQAKRIELMAFVDRWRYKAHSARQAQSRMKALAKMEPVAAAIEDPTLMFDFPSPAELRPPLVTLSDSQVGYVEGKPVLSNLNLRIDPDDRIALIGRNGNGKSTLVKLLYGELKSNKGSISKSKKVRIGYFAQHQIEDLVLDETPIQHMTEALPLANPSQIRSQLGRFGFSGDMANRKISQLSGGERSRLALALITRDAPHILLLDEPTNHLDVDAREALVQALTMYKGAIIIVSHDRHLLELSADRLLLLADGTATEYNGGLREYQEMLVGGVKKLSDNIDRTGVSTRPLKHKNKKERRRSSAQNRQQKSSLRDLVKRAETDMTNLMRERSLIDAVLVGKPLSNNHFENLKPADLAKVRASIEIKLKEAESKWLAASEGLEKL